MPRTFPDCPTCTHTDSQCEHRKQYDLLVEFVKNSGTVSKLTELSEQLSPEVSEERSWKGGEVEVIRKLIAIYRDSIKLHGWAMLSSILIHEFGHIKLYEKEKIYFGIVAEVKANQYGKANIPPELIPEFYDQYRLFALESYVDPDGWTTKELWEVQYELWLDKMAGAYPLK
jgi:hypothetical protein